METPAPHPIQLLVIDDLHRSRLTVFFRWLLAIPHLLWLGLWSSIAFVILVISWFATLAKGRSPDGLHDFLAGYLRYVTQLESYLLLAANPYPAFFVGTARPYPIDLEIDPPAPQNRWKTLFRLILVIPAVLLAGVLVMPAVLLARVLVGGLIASGGFRGLGLAGTAAFLVWFAALVRGRSPRGLRDATAWSIGYGAQAGAYLLLLTDRYPFTGPEAHLAGLEAPDVDEQLPRLVDGDHLRRSRTTVFLRLPLAFPHIFWLILWSLPALLAAIANWFSALAVGRAPRPLARFLAAYVRYSVHVMAFLFLIGNPFPGFVGKAESYPVDLTIDPFERQSRWITLFRLPLALPAALMAGAAGGVLSVVAILGWFVALLKGELPAGFQRAGAYAIGYSAQVNAYAFVLTDRYPHASPQAVFAGPEVEPEVEPESLDSEPPGAFV